MKLINNSKDYLVKNPRSKPGIWFSIQFVSSTMPENPLEGELRITSDSGEELCVVQASDYERQTIIGEVLTLTNEPEPEPTPAPEPVPIEPEPDPDEDRDAMLVDLEYRITLLELGVTE